MGFQSRTIGLTLLKLYTYFSQYIAWKTNFAKNLKCQEVNLQLVNETPFHAQFTFIRRAVIVPHSLPPVVATPVVVPVATGGGGGGRGVAACVHEGGGGNAVAANAGKILCYRLATN